MSTNRNRKKKKTSTRKFPVWVTPVVGVFGLLVAGLFLFGAHQESNDLFCASCHSEPEVSYVNREVQPAVDLAGQHAGKGVRCIDCHSGMGISGRMQAEVGGARNILVTVLGKDSSLHQMRHTMDDKNCLKCHGDVVKKQGFQNHFHLFLSQWQRISASAGHCVDCHRSHTTNGDANIAFLNEQTTIVVCQACHSNAG